MSAPEPGSLGPQPLHKPSVRDKKKPARAAGASTSHLDLMAWNLKTQPGRPEGGEAMGLRAVFAWLEQRYGGG